jgi:hypothetical protein
MIVVCCLVALPTVGYADNVDTLVSQLSDSSEKVRLSAALSLTKIGDARAIPAFVTALTNDSDKNVRATVAVGLGKLVTAQTKAAQRSAAINALTAAAKDESDFVRKQAEKSLQTVKGGGSEPGNSGPSGGIYLEIGPMSNKAKDSVGDMVAIMRQTSQKTLGRVAKDMALTWPGGKSPTKAQLDQKSVQGFYLDGTLTDMTIKEKGAATIVSCKVSMLLATLPDKSMFGFLNGGASVEASKDPADIASARTDCVDAVVEELVAKKVVSAIKTKAGQ